MDVDSKVNLVYRGLKRAIIDQALPPGAKLPEDAIGERFGVSRTIVRAALGRLAAEGLVESRLNRGASVARPTLAEARDVLLVRHGLERLVVESLAARVDGEAAEELLAHIAAEERAVGSEGPLSIRLAGEFHVLLAAATGNGVLARYVDEIVSRCSLILALHGRPHSAECAVAEHRQIVEALLAADSAEAVRVMDEHLGAIASRALLDETSKHQRDLHAILAPYATAPAREGPGRHRVGNRLRVS